MTQAVTCPGVEELQRVLRGQADEAHANDVDRHVQTCETCLGRVRMLLAEDSILAALRSGDSTEVRPGNTLPDLDSWVRRFKAMGPGADTLAESDTPRPWNDPVPERVGRYRILARVGRGGMGTVYKAEDPQLGRTVALKVPRFDGSDAERQLAAQRFLREARTAARVRHPHVCPIYDVGEHEGVPFVVMAFVEGASLADRLAGDARFESEADAVRLVAQVAEALEAIHREGIIHRDLKPANILLDPAGNPLLTDFGVARDNADAENLTATGVMVGTPAYMAPEQTTLVQEPVGPAADVYSLGVVLYRILTGRLPHEGSQLAVLHKIVNETPPRPSQLRPGLDAGLEAIVLRAMSRRAEERYGSAAELAAELRRWSPRGADRPAAPEKRRRIPALAIAAGVLLFIGGVILLQQVIIRLTDDKGNVREIAVKPNEKIDIIQPGDKGKASGGVDPRRAVADPPAIKPEPLPPIKGGEPLSPVALVQRPAEIKGVRSWSIETVKSRGPLSAVAYRPDGKRIAALAEDGVIRLLDAATYKLANVLAGPNESLLAWQPGATVLVSAGAQEAVGIWNGHLRYWDTERGMPVREVPLNSRPVTLAWSPDGKRLALGVSDAAGRSRVELRAGATGELEAALLFPLRITAVAWSPDGKRLAACGSILHASHAPQVYVWDAQSSEVLRKYKHDCYYANSLDWSQDGKLLFVSINDPPETRAWDVESGDVAWKATLHGKLAVSPDGAILAHATGELLSTKSGQLLRKLSINQDWRNLLSWSPDNRTLVLVDSHGALTFHDVASGELLKTAEALPPLPGIAPAAHAPVWSADGKALGIASDGHLANGYQLFEAATAKPLGKTLLPGFSPDGKRRHVVVSQTKSVIVEVASNKELLTLDYGGPVMGDRPFAWSKDGKRLALPTGRIWDTETGQPLPSPKPDQGWCVEFSPDGGILAFGMLNSSLRLWDIAAEAWREAFKGHHGPVDRLLWSADGKKLTSSAADGMRDWDVTTGRMVRHRKWRMGWPSPDGQFGADTHVNTLRVWDLETGQRRLTLMPLPDNRYVAFSPDGHYRGSQAVEREVVYVVQLEDGRQETLTPAEFAQRFGWKNDPERVGVAK